MKKIFFGLFIVIAAVANAGIVNDSIFVEPKYEKGLPQWLLSDTTHNAPISISLYYAETDNRFITKNYEIENLFTNKKTQIIEFGFQSKATLSSTFCFYDDINVIVNALKKMYEYSKTPFVEDNEETVFYKKDLPGNVFFFTSLIYDKTKSKWDCVVGLNRQYYKLDDREDGLFLLTRELEKAMQKCDQREQAYNESIYKKIIQKDGSSISYFESDNSSMLKLIVNEEINTKYRTEIINKKHTTKINNILNEIIKKKYQQFKTISNYGGFEVVIDENGNVVQSKLSLNKTLTNTLSNNVIGTMLKQINSFKFIPISNEDRLNDIEYVKVYIPLSREFNGSLSEVLVTGKTNIANNGFKEPVLKSEQTNNYTKYYLDSGDGLIELANNSPLVPDYTENLYEKRYAKILNLDINNILRKYYPNLKDFDNYGIAEVIVGQSGRGITSMISLNDEISKHLNNEEIIQLLNLIKDYKFEYFDKSDYPGVDFIKVCIPLKGQNY